MSSLAFIYYLSPKGKGKGKDSAILKAIFNKKKVRNYVLSNPKCPIGCLFLYEIVCDKLSYVPPIHYVHNVIIILIVNIYSYSFVVLFKI